MDKIGFALVGCGNIAKKYVHVFQNYMKDARIVGLCDLELERAQEYADVLGVPAFSDVKEMMSTIEDEVGALCILTPSGVHVKNVAELVEFRKPLIIEKPMALKLSEADEIIRKCDQFGVKMYVVHQNRFNAPILKAREAMEDGRFGKMVMGTVRLRWKRDQAYYDAAGWRGTWAYDGGVFTNQASHHIDMLTWFMGEVESVKAVGITRLADIECEDTGAAILRFENGSIGIIEATTATRPKDLEGSISILGDKGSVVIGGFFMNELTTWEFEDRQPSDDEVFEKYGSNQEGWGHNLGEYMKEVVLAIREDRAGLVDGLEGRKSLELISAIYESIETGREIQLRFRPEKCKLGVV